MTDEEKQCEEKECCRKKNRQCDYPHRDCSENEQEEEEEE